MGQLRRPARRFAAIDRKRGGKDLMQVKAKRISAR
jgi:hypothetical protein